MEEHYMQENIRLQNDLEKARKENAELAMQNEKLKKEIDDLEIELEDTNNTFLRIYNNLL